jgi:hypothetical protein
MRRLTAGLLTAILLAEADATEAPGAPKSATSEVLEAGAKLLQRRTPLSAVTAFTSTTALRAARWRRTITSPDSARI